MNRNRITPVTAMIAFLPTSERKKVSQRDIRAPEEAEEAGSGRWDYTCGPGARARRRDPIFLTRETHRRRRWSRVRRAARRAGAAARAGRRDPRRPAQLSPVPAAAVSSRDRRAGARADR